MENNRDNPAVSRVVIEQLADAEGVRPSELDPPLGTVIDPDALDQLFASRPETTGQITFQYRGYDVTVTSDGDVTIRSGNKIG